MSRSPTGNARAWRGRALGLCSCLAGDTCDSSGGGDGATRVRGSWDGRSAGCVGVVLQDFGGSPIHGRSFVAPQEQVTESVGLHMRLWCRPRWRQLTARGSGLRPCLCQAGRRQVLRAFLLGLRGVGQGTFVACGRQVRRVDWGPPTSKEVINNLYWTRRPRRAIHLLIWAAQGFGVKGSCDASVGSALGARLFLLGVLQLLQAGRLACAGPALADVLKP